jgi:hypothetical protein
MSFKTALGIQPLHRRIEKALDIEKGCCKALVKQAYALKMTDSDILESVKGCIEWMQVFGQDNFVIAYQLYLSCLKEQHRMASFPQEGVSDGSAKR